MVGEYLEKTYAKINSIRSINQMQQKLTELSKISRNVIILHALQHSECQFTWSFFAKKFEIPKKQWPDQLDMSHGRGLKGCK